MADLKIRIEVEAANIERVLEQMPDAVSLPKLSPLELAGVGTLLHNLYNGIENILKQIILSKKVPVPTSASWHRDLLSLAAREKIISDSTKDLLAEYLAFRHFFTHAYALDLYPNRLESLVGGAKNLVAEFNRDLRPLL